MKHILTALTLFLLTLSVYASDYKTLKKQGVIGELQNGYVAPVKNNAVAGIIKIVKNVNNKRRERYTELASKQKLDLSQIQALAAQKLIKKLGQGQYYKNSSGTWIKKN